MVETVIHRLNMALNGPEKRLSPLRKRQGGFRVAENKVAAQQQNPVRAIGERYSDLYDPGFECRFIDLGRVASQAFDKSLDVQNYIDDVPELDFPDEVHR